MRGTFKNGDGNIAAPRTSEGGDPGANYIDEGGHVWPLLVADQDGFLITKWKTAAPSDGAYGAFDASARVGVTVTQADLVDAVDQFVDQYATQHGRVAPPEDDRGFFEKLGGSPGFALVVVAAWLVWTDNKRSRRGRR